MPVFTARVEETIVKPREKVLSAERSPPPNMGAVVLMVLVLETMVNPREIVGVPVAVSTNTGAVPVKVCTPTLFKVMVPVVFTTCK